MSGWIKLHRDLLEWEWFDEPKVSHLFIYLLLKASHTENTWKGTVFAPGQLAFSYRNASLETGLSEKSIRTALGKLKNTGEVAVESSRKGSVITVENWNSHQVGADETATKRRQNGDKTATKRRQNGDKTAAKGRQNGGKRATLKNVKNVKNVKNINKSGVTYTPDSKFPLEEIYKAYPRIGERAPGLKVLEKIITTQKEFELVLLGAKKYKEKMAKEKREPKYIKNFKTWVNNSGWEDTGEDEDLTSPKTEAEAFEWLRENYHKLQ